MILFRKIFFTVLAINSFHAFSMENPDDLVASLREHYKDLEKEQNVLPAPLIIKEKETAASQAPTINTRSKRTLESSFSSNDETSDSESEETDENVRAKGSLRWITECIRRIAKSGPFTKEECNSIAKRSKAILNESFEQLIKDKVIEKIGSSEKYQLISSNKTTPANRPQRKMVEAKKMRKNLHESTSGEEESENTDNNKTKEDPNIKILRTFAFFGTERIFEMRKIKPTVMQKEILKRAILHPDLSVDMRKAREEQIRDLLLLGFIQERSQEDAQGKSKYMLALPPVMPPTLD